MTRGSKAAAILMSTTLLVQIVLALAHSRVVEAAGQPV